MSQRQETQDGIARSAINSSINLGPTSAATAFAWVSIAPFGIPVVPEV